MAQPIKHGEKSAIVCPDCKATNEIREANGMVCLGRRHGGCSHYRNRYAICACGTMMIEDPKNPGLFFRAPQQPLWNRKRQQAAKQAQGKLF